MATKKIFLNIAAIVFSLGIISVANAVNPFDISYPVAELGNCGSQEECKLFCDNSDNQVACVEWAQGKGFVTEGETKRVKDMRRFNDDEVAPIEDFGPGGCKTPRECDMFCRVLENLNKCMSYSVSHGYMSQEEADKILAKANRGGPGGCKNERECDDFCRKTENIEICMNFAVEEGKISKEEADFIITRTKEFGAGEGRRGPGKPASQRGPAEPKVDEQKALKVLEEKGAGPGGCKSMEECGNYCGTPEHREECMNFAVENGFMPPEEVEKAKKMMTMAGPGGCRGPRECDAYCSQKEHGEECMNFSIQNGLLAPEEADKMKKEMEIVKKLQGGAIAGPGGCKGPQECQAYCSDQSHMEECINFASQNGMINKNEANMKMRQFQDAQKMMQMGEQDRQRFMMPPPNGEMGPPPGQGGMFPPPFDGMMPFRQSAEPQEGEQVMPPEGVPFEQGGFMPPSGIVPPPGEGGEFMPPGGFIPPEGMTQPPTNMMPPPEMMQQYQEAMPPPSSGEMMPPPPPSESMPPPPAQSLPGAVGILFNPFLDIFR